jgi:hypothetical protein
MRRFLDIGTGLPIADNTHEVGQRSGPDSRIVYVDFDPSVLRHAQALLTSTPVGGTEDRPLCHLDADPEYRILQILISGLGARPRRPHGISHT